jgi:hypothetical protein
MSDEANQKDPNMKTKILVDEWHSFIPFLTNIKAVRDYMG